SRWFLHQADGTYTDPGVGDLISTPFSWGSGAADYDNDGDPDIIFHGGLDDGPFIDASNAGTFLRNQGCHADFVHDQDALSGTDHQRRNVQGVAVGDLDNDGFPDVVSVSNFDTPQPTPQVPYGVDYDSTFDAAAFVPTFAPTGTPFEFVYTGIEVEDGTLSVELNSAGNDNNWVQVRTVGAVGLTDDGVVNRDGLGATVMLTPHGGVSAMSAVHSGGTYASDHSRTLGFGLGAASFARLDVTWPGGVKNRLYGAHDGETIVFPEIPCSIDAGGSFSSYRKCAKESLKDLRNSGVITNAQRKRFYFSAVLGWLAETFG
ncbi:MAG: CRTAC1 family protein, partial [Nannocystaceae bacterium]|nr:CRTAC1 family protein [Nannocystaceae bacterium]